MAYGEAGDSNLTLYEKGPSDDNFARVATDPSTGLPLTLGTSGTLLFPAEGGRQYAFRLRADKAGVVAWTDAPPVAAHGTVPPIQNLLAADGTVSFTVPDFQGAYAYIYAEARSPDSPNGAWFYPFLNGLVDNTFVAGQAVTLAPGDFTSVGSLGGFAHYDVRFQVVADDGNGMQRTSDWSDAVPVAGSGQFTAPAAGVTATVSADTPWAYDVTWQGQAGWSLSVGEAWDAGPDPDLSAFFDQGGGTQTAGVAPGGFLEGVFTDAQGNQSYAFALTGLFPTAPVALAAPTNLSATPSTDGQGNPQVNLVWDDNADNETGYTVERSANGGPFVQLAATQADAVTYVDQTPAAGVDYTYRVKATGAAGDSAYSNVADLGVPAAPTDLTATADQANGVVDLSWTNHADNADGIEVLWSSDGRTFTAIDDLLPDATTYADTRPTFGRANYYQVVAYRDAGETSLESAPSNTASDGPVEAPVAVADDDGGANAAGTLAPYVVAHDQTLTVPADQGVLANDYDPAGLPLHVAAYTQPADGSVTLDTGTGGFTYVPDAGWSGTDTFTYTLSNGIVAASPVGVAVTVTYDPPTASDEHLKLGQDGTTAGTLAPAASDPSGGPLTFKVADGGGPLYGTLTLNADGSYTYAAGSSFRGVDRFRYVANGGGPDSAAATVVVTAEGTTYAPPASQNAPPAAPAAFPATLAGVWGSIVQAKMRLIDLGVALADAGSAAKALGSGPDPASDSDVGSALALVDQVTAATDRASAAYGAYLAQQRTVFSVAGAYMKGVWYTSDDDRKAAAAVQALPTTVLGLTPDRTQLDELNLSLANFDAGATWMWPTTRSRWRRRRRRTTRWRRRWRPGG